MAHVRGCMVIKPWGYGIWEKIQNILGDMIKNTGAENAYFPLFIPLSYIQKEAAHVDGFAKEMAVVTHHRLEKKDGQLVAAAELPEPVIVRPTSETIIGESFSTWIKSYRDLPIKINQWCNVVRWEMRPRIFLRTVEFLWQEGHTAFATEMEALQDTNQMINVYKEFVENWLAIPVIMGAKPAYDRFPGAEETFSIEAMMQDGKALQAGTSHYLGQNFSRSANISFSDRDMNEKFAYTTSWGVSTRLIGGLIMTHGDDDGLRVPPKIAPQQVVIIPILRGKCEETDQKVTAYAKKIAEILSSCCFDTEQIPVIAKVDSRQINPAEKKWQWIKKGIPLQVEVGPRDIENATLALRKRSEDSQAKSIISLDDLKKSIGSILDEIQQSYFEQAKARMSSSIKDVTEFKELSELFNSDDFQGFIKAPWHPSNTEDDRLQEMNVTIRCVMSAQNQEQKKCILTGKTTSTEAIFAKAY